MAHAIPYREAILWMLHNDDVSWLADDEPILSVVAGLVADIYGKSKEQVIADLRKAKRISGVG